MLFHVFTDLVRAISTLKKMHTRRNGRENGHVLLNRQLLLTRTYTFYCKPWVMARYDSKTRDAKLYYCTAYGVSVMQFSVTKLPRSYSDKKERRGLDWREKEMKELTHVHCLDSQSACMRAFWLQLECMCVCVCVYHVHTASSTLWCYMLIEQVKEDTVSQLASHVITIINWTQHDKFIIRSTMPLKANTCKLRLFFLCVFIDV